LPKRASRHLQALLGENQAAPLIATINSDAAESERNEARDKLIAVLLDRHGTGRILFRNTRQNITGFCGRTLHEYPLMLPLPYRSMEADSLSLNLALYPECAWQQSCAEDPNVTPWWRFDPRVQWLIELLKSHKHSKVLVICAHQETVLLLEEGLRVFQFCHHLVLFDLPRHPDLLEQRIGRLDRIGQEQAVQIHVPWFIGTAQERLFQWFHEGLNAFLDACPVGSMLYDLLQDSLEAQLLPALSDPPSFQTLLSQTQQLYQEATRQLHQGRDRLLEMHSQGHGRQLNLIREITESDHSRMLTTYLEQVLDCFGVETEPHSGKSLVIRRSPHMITEDLPWLSDEGATYTWDRDLALSREDYQFLSWEHPLVTGSMERIIRSSWGNTAVAALSPGLLKPGIMLLEVIFVVDTGATAEMQLHRFMPVTSVRILVDPRLNDLSQQVAFAALDKHTSPIKRALAEKLVKARRGEIETMLAAAHGAMQPKAQALIAQACRTFEEAMLSESGRLQELARLNSNVRQEEITHLDQLLAKGLAMLKMTCPRVDALRILFST
jgi:ATP-dependent helicase HepA